MRSKLLPLLLLPTAAQAVPMFLTHQGRLLDDGVPLDGDHQIEAALFTTASAGASEWDALETVAFDNGYYAMTLGSTSNPLPADAFAGDLWLELTIDGTTTLDRVRVHSVPFAIRATTATDLRGGTVEATSVRVGDVLVDEGGITVGGDVVIDADGTVVGGGSGGFDLECDVDQSPWWDGAEWSCGPAFLGTIPWEDVDDRPPGLDDGDDDTLAALSCAEGAAPVARRGGSWTCPSAAPATVATLTLVGTSGTLTLPVAGYRVQVDRPTTVSSSLPDIAPPVLRPIEVTLGPEVPLYALLAAQPVAPFSSGTLVPTGAGPSWAFGTASIAEVTVGTPSKLVFLPMSLTHSSPEGSFVYDGMTRSATTTCASPSGPWALRITTDGTAGSGVAFSTWSFGQETALPSGGAGGAGGGRAVASDLVLDGAAPLTCLAARLLTMGVYNAADAVQISAYADRPTGPIVRATLNSTCGAFASVSWALGADGMRSSLTIRPGQLGGTETQFDANGNPAGNQTFNWSYVLNQPSSSCE